MGIVVQPSSGDVPEIADSLYTATIRGYKAITLEQPDQFGKTEKIELNLELDVDGEVVKLDPRVNQAWSEKATLFIVAQAAGLDPDPYEAFDIDMLLGRQVNVLTEQEPGKWPRVKAWSRVPQRRAQKAAPAASPSMINGDGSPNHTAFWAGISALGLTRAHVIERVGGDIENFTAMDGADVAVLFEELKAQVSK